MGKSCKKWADRRVFGEKMGKEWGYNQDFTDFEGESGMNIW